MNNQTVSKISSLLKEVPENKAGILIEFRNREKGSSGGMYALMFNANERKHA